MENAIHIRIPIERIGALIGPSGRTKKVVENRLTVTVTIDGKTGSVWVAPATNNTDPVTILRARDIVLAVGRGFPPEKAFRLLNDETALGIIDLREIFGKSESDISRVKGRIIGRKGKSRRMIEELTGVDVRIYGHTVSIIGDPNQLNVAKEAIQRLIRGDQHKNIYDFLQRKRQELRLQEIELWKPTLDHLDREE